MSAQLLEFRQKGKSGTVESLLDHVCKLEREIQRISHDSKTGRFDTFYRKRQNGSCMMHHQYLKMLHL